VSYRVTFRINHVLSERARVSACTGAEGFIHSEESVDFLKITPSALRPQIFFEIHCLLSCAPNIGKKKFILILSRPVYVYY